MTFTLVIMPGLTHAGYFRTRWPGFMIVILASYLVIPLIFEYCVVAVITATVVYLAISAFAIRDPDGNVPHPRIGIHAGGLTAGVMGQRRFMYDPWGDTVNTASRMQTPGEPDRIQVSDNVRRRLDARYELSHEAKSRSRAKDGWPPGICWAARMTM